MLKTPEIPGFAADAWDRRDVLRRAGWWGMIGAIGGMGWLGGAEVPQGPSALPQGPSALPLSVRFRGKPRFEALLAKARREGWRTLPIGERMIRFAKELRGTPYVGYTLEIDDRIEAPSANFEGLDCWSFFETCLDLARMIAVEQPAYGPEDLLREIGFTRYRGGVCTGNYLQRLHYLEEWFFDNHARGVVENITPALGGAQAIQGRKCEEMTVLWKNYRYLAKNPELRPRMAKLEEKVSLLPVRYIPEKRVAAIESKLQNGDILGIVTKHQGAFCSHVGLACRTQDGALRLMHASSQRKYRRVIIDEPVSAYLKALSGSIGIIVGRPREVGQTIRDPAVYQKNLLALVGSQALIADLDP